MAPPASNTALRNESLEGVIAGALFVGLLVGVLSGVIITSLLGWLVCRSKRKEALVEEGGMGGGSAESKEHSAGEALESEGRQEGGTEGTGRREGGTERQEAEERRVELSPTRTPSSGSPETPEEEVERRESTEERGEEMVMRGEQTSMPSDLTITNPVTPELPHMETPPETPSPSTSQKSLQNSH